MNHDKGYCWCGQCKLERFARLMSNRDELVYLEDGFLYYWPTCKNGGGALSPEDLRIIASFLDMVNAPLEEEIDRYFENKDKVELRHEI